MGGIYGDFLSFFPELYQTVEFYSQTPTVEAGYKDRTSAGKYRVVFQDDTGRGLSGPAGRLSFNSQWRTLDMTDSCLMWSEKKIPVGLFFKHPNRSGDVFRVTTILAFNREGGYYEYDVQKVTGDTGDQDGRLKKAKGVY